MAMVFREHLRVYANPMRCTFMRLPMIAMTTILTSLLPVNKKMKDSRT